jgi:hypothetical protein
VRFLPIDTPTQKVEVTREKIIQTLIDALKPLDYVHAYYEGGAVAFNRVDEWSDIDAYVVVDDDKINETFAVVEKALESLSPIKLKYEVQQTPWEGLSQAFYKLENASEYLIIDLAVLKLSSPEKLLEPEIHNNAVFYFNKSNKVTIPRLNKDAFIKELKKILERRRARFELFNSFVQKEINRGNFLEAIDLYYSLTLASLVEALRIKYNPLHYNFKMRYIHYELPPEIIKKLENLYSINDKKDLQKKYDEATEWYKEAMAEINPEEIEQLINA